MRRENMSGRGGGGNVALITRRSFARQTAFAAALCASPLRGWRELLDANERSDSPLDAESIRNWLLISLVM